MAFHNEPVTTGVVIRALLVVTGLIATLTDASPASRRTTLLPAGADAAATAPRIAIDRARMRSRISKTSTASAELVIAPFISQTTTYPHSKRK